MDYACKKKKSNSEWVHVLNVRKCNAWTGQLDMRERERGFGDRWRTEEWYESKEYGVGIHTDWRVRTVEDTHLHRRWLFSTPSARSLRRSPSSNTSSLVHIPPDKHVPVPVSQNNVHLPLAILYFTRLTAPSRIRAVPFRCQSLTHPIKRKEIWGI